MATRKLSMAHEATFNNHHVLLIQATLGDRECVALTRKEVAALRALITPPVNNEGIDKLLDGINEKACDIDYTIYGLPLYGKDMAVRESFRKIVRDWLNTLNQTPAPSSD